MGQPNLPSANSRSEASHSSSSAYEQGQRLYCAACHSEIEIVSPCTCNPPDQQFLCCGRPMAPSTGASVHVNVEG